MKSLAIALRIVLLVSLFSLPLIAQSNPAITQLFAFSCDPQTDICKNGSDPNGGLIQASNGKFYGTTFLSGNGAPNQTGGTVFGITGTGKLRTLFTFSADQSGNFSNGDQPIAGLVEGKDGFLYGTTTGGGKNKAGVIFKISRVGKFVVLYHFCSVAACADGSTPQAPLIFGSDGNLYGTTIAGGTAGFGTVFRVTTNGAFTVLHSFNGTSDGGKLASGVIQASDGNFYGSAKTGIDFLEANLFRITPNGTFTVLANLGFPGVVQGQLTQAKDGNLYGVVQYGYVFQSNLNGSNVHIIHELSVTEVGSDGIGAGLVQASDGNLWGTSLGQGLGPNYGVIYSLTTSGTFLQSFAFNCTNGGMPKAAVLQGRDHNLYGTAAQCGQDANRRRAFGTIFTLKAGL